jgi:hypothetical protein
MSANKGSNATEESVRANPVDSSLIDGIQGSKDEGKEQLGGSIEQMLRMLILE